MLQSTKEAYYEVDSILNFMSQENVNEIPIQLRRKFKEQKAKNYNKEINPTKELKEQNLKRETLAILAVLNYKYWVKDEEKKKELIALYYENEKRHQQRLKEKYNPDNMFKNKASNKTEEKLEKYNSDKMLVAIKEESIFKKIINKIKKILNKNK